MKNSLMLFFTIATSIQIKSQPSIEWQKALGGTDYDVAYTMQSTSDGGYIIGGYAASENGDITDSHGFYDYWVVKLDESGSIMWEKSLGGTGTDVTYSIQQTTDGGYIAAGSSNSINGDIADNHGFYDYWVVKLDESGSILWEKSFGGSSLDEAKSIQQTIDGGYILAGKSESDNGDVTDHYGSTTYGDYWIVKIDVSGDILWEKALGGTGEDVANCIQQTTDGGYIIAGSSSSNDEDVTGHHGGSAISDYWVVKIDESGNILWERSLGGSGYDKANSIKQTTDSGYIVAGTSYSDDGDVTGNHGMYDYWVVKLDESGNNMWEKSYGGGSYDMAYSIQPTIDGGYIVAGYADSEDGDITDNHGSYDYWLIKLDESGNILWEKSLGGTLNDEATSIQPTPDGGYIVVGYTSSSNIDVTDFHGFSDYWVVKLEGCNIPVSISLDDVSLCAGSSILLTAVGGEEFEWSPPESLDTTIGNSVTASPIATITYTVIATDSSGCSTSDDITITVNPLPLPTITVDASGLCTNIFISYQWQSDGIDILGATSQCFSITESGNYTVIVKDSNDCNAVSDVFIFTSVENSFEENRVTISPNPSNGQFAIQMNSTDLNQPQINISITNILGEEIFNKSSEIINWKLSEKINLENVAPGIYLVTIKSDKGIIESKKLVIL